jgi:hypothetical protein
MSYGSMPLPHDSVGKAPAGYMILFGVKFVVSSILKLMLLLYTIELFNQTSDHKADIS